jgi:spoIIIJ-associated protein
MDNEVVSQQLEQRVAELLRLLNYTATIVVDLVETEGKKYLNVKLSLDHGGSELIGFHGKTLEALATVITLLMPQTEERYGVLLDVNDYRAERYKYIENLTNKAIDQVLNTSQPVELLPMSPAERRVVHTTASGRTDIVTVSEGEDENRHVIIKPVF